MIIEKELVVVFGCYVSFFTTYNRGYDGITFFDWGEIDGFNIREIFG